MRLVVVSNMAHHVDGDGRAVGWGPTVRELDQLAMLFDEIVNVAPVHDEAPPGNAAHYESQRIRVRAVRPAGGSGVFAKLGILRQIPSWVRTIRSELRHADAVHVRSPANISLVALVVLALARRPRARWLKYAGNWSPETPDAASYRLQRWILRSNLCRAAVTVNGSWPGQPAHVHSFDNPTLTDDELRIAACVAAEKTRDGELRIAFSGRVVEDKGAGRALEIADRLATAGVRFHLALAGDGPGRRRYEALASALGLGAYVTFCGWLDRAALDRVYAEAHVNLLPTDACEGFPKALAEGMAYGAVPLAGDVSCIGQVLSAAGTGAVIPPHDTDAFADAIEQLSAPDRWRHESAAAVRGASRFTYGRYLDALRELFRSSWEIGLGPAASQRPARPLRIGVFGPHLGGNDGWVVSQGEVLVGMLSDNGHEVHQASTRPRRAPRAVDTAATLLRVAGSLDVAIVAVFGDLGFGMAEMTTAVAVMRGVPVVLVLHGGSLPSLAARSPRRIRRLLERATVVTSPTPYLARELAGLRNDIVVIPNALPLPDYPARTRSPVRRRLLWMRTFEDVYRPELALEVLALLQRSDPSVTLTLAGQDKGLLESMKRRAADLGVMHVVTFPGFLNPARKRQAFDDHDVFLSTSAIDNAPVSVLEAARSGLVIVGGDAGGLGDLVTHGENALLVPYGDVPAMAAVVQRVFDDAPLAATLSEGGQRLGTPSTRERLKPRWEALLRTAVK